MKIPHQKYGEVTCPECGEETTVNLTPYIPAKLTGHPDSWHPEEGGFIEPDHCPECNCELPTDGLPI